MVSADVIACTVENSARIKVKTVLHIIVFHRLHNYRGV